MRQQQYRLLKLLIVFGCAIGLFLVGARDDPIVMTSRLLIQAGDEWQVSVKIDDAQAGETAMVTLVNGLQFLDETLILGTGGIAIWQIPADTITQAGTSQLIVRYKDLVARQSLLVLPHKATALDLFADSNNIVAYGESSTNIMILPYDEWGNTPIISEQYTMEVTYPDTTQTTGEFEMLAGIGLYPLTSQGVPGRIRLEASTDQVSANLELLQNPSQADSISLTVDPNCVLNDGRDIVTLAMEVTDKYHQAVVDGTLVAVLWKDGIGYARTIDGHATLRLPAFQTTGDIVFNARVRDIYSPDAILQIVEESCLD